MGRLKFIRGLQFGRLRRSVEYRGVKGTMFHAIRRMGTMMDRALVGPVAIRINPMGFVCNHVCPMCWLQHLDPDLLKEKKRSDREEGLTCEEYVRLLDTMPPGLEEVNIVGGGEPLVHPDCVRIMEEIRRRKIRGSLITNGSLMKEGTATAMVRMRWDHTRVSVHAGDPETFKAIQGVDKFETVRNNLKRFTELRREAGADGSCTLAIYHCIQHENIPRIESLFQFAEDVGADMIFFEKIIPYDDSKWLSPEELAFAREELQKHASQSRVPCNLDVILPQLAAEEKSVAQEGRPWVPAKRCSVGFDQAFIYSTGDVAPCCFSSEIMGNVRTTPFHTIWNGEKYRKFRNALMQGKFRSYCISNRCHLEHVLHND